MYIILNIGTVFPYFGCEEKILQYQNGKLEQILGSLLSELEDESNRIYSINKILVNGELGNQSIGTGLCDVMKNNFSTVFCIIYTAGRT